MSASKRFFQGEVPKPQVENLDNAEEKRKRSVRAGIEMPKEMPGIEGAAGEKVKEKGENPYLRVQIREAAMRNQLSLTLDDATVEKVMVKIRANESNNLVNMDKEAARALAAQYAKLEQIDSDDEQMAAK